MNSKARLISAAEIIKEDYMEPLQLSGAALAKCIGVSPSTVNRMLNGTSQLTAEMAVKICAVVGGSPVVLMRIEAEYRLALAESKVNSNYGTHDVTNLSYFYCHSCGYEGFDIVAPFDGTFANGDFYRCPECDNPSSTFEEAQ